MGLINPVAYKNLESISCKRAMLLPRFCGVETSTTSLHSSNAGQLVIASKQTPREEKNKDGDGVCLCEGETPS